MTASPRIGILLKGTAFAAAALGIALRCYRAANIGLGVDECLQLLPVHSNSLREAFASFATFAHPPLLLLFLYPLSSLTFTEFGARVIPLLSSVLLPVVLYIWLRNRAGLIAAYTTIAIVSLSSNWIVLTPQVRSYSQAFLFFALALLWLDQAIDRVHPPRMGLAGAALALAILSDYSLAFVCPAITLYGFARLYETRAPRSLWSAWAAAIVLALFTFGLLYWFQVRQYGYSPSDLANTYLRERFRLPGESLARFVAWSIYHQFVYLAGRQSTGILLALPFLLVLPFVSLAWRLLLLTPFATGLALCLLRMLPFGQSRHSSIVTLLIAVGIGLAAQRWLASRPRAWLAIASTSIAVCYFTARPHQMDWLDRNLNPRTFRDAARYAGSLPTLGASILTSGHAREILQYYRVMQKAAPLNVTGYSYEDMQPEYLIAEISAIRAKARLRPGDPVFVVDAGIYPFRYPPAQPSAPVRKFGRLRFWRLEGTNQPSGIPISTPAASPVRFNSMPAVSPPALPPR